MKDGPKTILKFKVDEQPYTLALSDEAGLGLTPREAGRIKQLASGTAGIRILEALSVLDAEVIAALAIVAAARAGVVLDENAVLDGKSVIALDFDAPEASPLDESAVAVEAAASEPTSPTITPIPVGIGGLS